MFDALQRHGRANPTGSRVLVVGLGFIGTHVATRLAAIGTSIRVLTRSQPSSHLRARLDLDDVIVGDAADRAVVKRALDGVREVVYCAGGLLPAHSAQDPELDTRLTMTPLRTTLDVLRDRPGVGFIYVSSGGTVYGHPTTIPTPEDHPKRPVSSYGRIRVRSEEEIERHRRDYALRARILRCATVYGEHQEPDRGQGAVATFLRHVEEDRPIVLYGAPGNARDYLYAGDLATVVTALLDRDDGPSILNVGSGVGTSLDQLVALIEAEVGRSAEVDRRPPRPFDVHRIILDVARLQSLIDFRPTPLTEGVRRTHAWLYPDPATADRVA